MGVSVPGQVVGSVTSVWNAPLSSTVTCPRSSALSSASVAPIRMTNSRPGSSPWPSIRICWPTAPLDGSIVTNDSSVSPSKGTVATPRMSPSSVTTSTSSSGPVMGVPSSQRAGICTSRVTRPSLSVCPWPSGSAVKPAVTGLRWTSTAVSGGKPTPVMVTGIFGPTVDGSTWTVGAFSLSTGAGGVV